MATNTSSDAPQLFTLAARDGKQWRELLTGATLRACESMREALGLPSTRLYRTGRTLRDKLPHSCAPSRDYAAVPVERYIAWLDADARRVAYVYPWTANRRSTSDEVRRVLEKRGPVVEVDPNDCTEETEP